MIFSKDLIIILSQRSWQALAGFLTTIFITKYLSPEEQGWYYSFISVSALYVLFELGVSSALSQISSRMFIHLVWDDGGNVKGQGREKFNAFFVASIKYYLMIAVLFFLVVSLGGYFFFQHSSASSLLNSQWTFPWIMLILLTAINLLTLPIISIVEGSGNIAEVYLLRLAQGVVGSILCWFALISGGKLWCILMMPLSSILIFVFWMTTKKLGLYRVLRSSVNNQKFNWSKEVLSFQWRVGLSWISVYAMSQLIVPIVFYFINPEVAGQLGMCLAIAHMIGILSGSWITRHLPIMSKAVGKKEWQFFDETFKKDFEYSVIFYLLSSLVLMGLYGLVFRTEYGIRLLDPNLFAFLLVFVFLYHISNSLAMHLRCHKKEPLVWLFLLGAILNVSFVIFSSKIYSVSWVIYSICLIQAFLIVPGSYYLWKRNNKLWRLLK
jgi:O-antigen/teichoic acid export membrane protein